MSAPAKPRSTSTHRARRQTLRIELLEPRLLLFADSGYRWADPNVSFSFVPEGANVEGFTNTLFSRLDQVAPTSVWQREFARALQTWANSSNLNFHLVADSGAPSGSSGPAQGDPRFGDIRLAMHPLSGPLAYAYYPSGSVTITGDIFLSTEFGFQVGANYDLFSTLLHESGHSLGLRHSAGSVMNSYYQGVLSGLTADDVAGIQSIYGVRQHDAYDSAAANNSMASATTISVAADGSFSGRGDLQSMGDVDYYAFATPDSSDGAFSISIDATGLSLLAPKVAVYNASGALLGQADVGSAYGTTATVNLSGLVPSEVLYVMADGATDDAFGMGAYRISAAFGVPDGGGGGDPDPAPGPAPDRYEVNDTFAAGVNLGKFSNSTVTGLTLHSTADVDHYRFTSNQAGTYQISTRIAAGSAPKITIYNSSGSVIEETTKGLAVLSLGKYTTTYFSISSPAGAVDVYDLVFTKIGGQGHPKGQKSGHLQPDSYFADVSQVDHHDDGPPQDEDRQAASDIDLWSSATANGRLNGVSASVTAPRTSLTQSVERSGLAFAFGRDAASAAAVVTPSQGASATTLRREPREISGGDHGEVVQEWAAAIDDLISSMPV